MIDDIIKDDFFYRYISDFTFSEIMISEFGFEKCSPAKEIVVNEKEIHNIIHFVVAGTGKLIIEDKEYIVSKGDMFIFPLNKKNVYFPNPNSPWHYFWISFLGEKSQEILSYTQSNWESPVHKVKNFKKMFEVFSKLYFNAKEYANNLDLLGFSVFTEILMILKNENPSSKNYENSDNKTIHFLIGYINHNLFNNNLLSLFEMSKQVYLTPNYLSHLFKKQTGSSIQNYIIQLRLIEAKKLLTDTELTVKQIAEKCGYPNQLYFSRIFKKYLSVSPTDYRVIQRDYNKSKEE